MRALVCHHMTNQSNHSVQFLLHLPHFAWAPFHLSYCLRCPLSLTYDLSSNRQESLVRALSFFFNAFAATAAGSRDFHYTTGCASHPVSNVAGCCAYKQVQTLHCARENSNPISQE